MQGEICFCCFIFSGGETVENPSSKKVNFEKTVIDYIGENYMHPISSADAAILLDYNHNYFCRAFKKSFGCRFGDYLNGYRIRRAQELLITRKITEVSGMVGFSGNKLLLGCFQKDNGNFPFGLQEAIQIKDCSGEQSFKVNIKSYNLFRIFQDKHRR